MSYTVFATQKLLLRLKCPVVAEPPVATTVLGDWYATAIYGRPQSALFVNELTRLSVVMDLAPSATVLDRFPAALARVLKDLGIDPDFIERETTSMIASSVATTRNRSVTGQMTNFVQFLEFARRHRPGESNDVLAARLGEYPVGLSTQDAYHPSDRVRQVARDPTVAESWRVTTRAARATKSVVPDIDVARVRRYCQRAVPPSRQDQLRMESRVEGRTITIFECRPPWRDDEPDREWSSLAIAQLRWNPESATWSLFWGDSNDRWRRCQWIKKSGMDDALAAIERNEYGVFFG